MKKSHTPFDYPIVIRQQLGMITVSVPDLNIVLAEDLSLGGKIDKGFLIKVAKALGKTWIKVHEEIEKKDANKIPKPSQTKEILSPKYKSKPLTASVAAKVLGVSVNTLRRMSDRGEIKTDYTAKGHRRFSENAVLNCKAKLESKSVPPIISLDQ